MERSAGNQGRRVLVIEDNSAIRTLMEEMLTDAGYRVTARDDVLDLEEVQRLEPDVVVLDVMIGDRRAGLDYLYALRRIPSLQRVPVIVCSGERSCLEQLEAADPSPATMVMLKPVRLVQFLDKISEVIEQGHAAASSRVGHGAQPWARWFHPLISTHEGPGRDGKMRRDDGPILRSWLARNADALHGSGTPGSK